jgi:hypothetical protein
MIKIFTKLILSIGLLLGCCAAHATEWIPIFLNKDVQKYYDNSTVKRIDGVVTLWTLTNYLQTPDSLKTKIKSVKTLESYDCKNRKYRSLGGNAYASFDGKGNLLEQSPEQKVWFLVIPETIGEVEFTRVCNIK